MQPAQVLGAPGFGGIEDILGDLFGFGDVFGGGRAGGRDDQRRRRGADLRYDLEISLEEAANGMTAQLRIPRLEGCETCQRFWRCTPELNPKVATRAAAPVRFVISRDSFRSPELVMRVAARDE